MILVEIQHKMLFKYKVLNFKLMYGSSDPPHLSVVSDMGLNIAKAAQISGVSLHMSNGGELILQEGGTFDNSNVDFNDSVFKPTGAVSVTNGGFNLHGTSSVVLQGDTTFSQSGDIYWPGLDLNGNSLTFGGEGANISIVEALNIANGESLISGSSRLHFDNTLEIDDGGELISGTGDVILAGPLTLNGEIEQGGGIIDLIQGGTVGVSCTSLPASASGSVRRVAVGVSGH